MPNILDENGLQIKDIAEILDQIINGDESISGLKDIYGADINTDPDTPDGQLINIFAQANYDILELAREIYNSFDPDRAVGVTLNSRVNINGIARKGGTFTITPVEITTDRSVTLEGLDDDINSVDGTGYTVSDDSGNEFILTESTTIGAGTNTLNFRAKEIGAVQTTINTITNQNTVVLGVTSVNNPSGASSVGRDEETDTTLRLRRQRSTAIASTGYLDGLAGGILDLDGVTQVLALKNNTSVTDSDGIPGHSIWVIVENGSSSEIAEEIYKRITPGTGMKGSVTEDIDRIYGDTVEIKFDRPEDEDLYIEFGIEPVTVGETFDTTYIKQQLASRLDLSIDEAANITDIACLLEEIEPDAVYTGLGVSLDGVYYDDIVRPTARNKILKTSVARIDIT